MDLGEELRDRGVGFGARDAIEMADLVERPNLLLKGSGRVNRILGPEEDLTDILGKSLRQARRQREQSCRVRLASFCRGTRKAVSDQGLAMFGPGRFSLRIRIFFLAMYVCYVTYMHHAT